jgi:hypothetical protein
VIKLAEYHVGKGLAGIYAGTIEKSGIWRNKSDVTDEAIAAVFLWFAEHIELDDSAEYSITYASSKYELVMRCKEVMNNGTNQQADN